MRGRKKLTKKVVQMDRSKAQLLVEQGCLISLRNKIYANPPIEESILDCITARRTVPCGHCLPKSGVALEFPSSPYSLDEPLAPFRAEARPVQSVLPSSPRPLTLTTVPKSKPDQPMTAKMRSAAEAELMVFGEVVRRQEKANDSGGYAPRSSYFPLPALQSVITNLTRITVTEDLRVLLPQWSHYSAHGGQLFVLVQRLQASFRDQHNTARLLRNQKSRARAQAKRTAAAADQDDDIDELSESETPVHPSLPPALRSFPTSSRDDLLSSTPSPAISAPIATSMAGPSNPVEKKGGKRPAFENHTNQLRAKRARPESAEAVARSFGPAYRTRAGGSRRYRGTSNENTAPDDDPSGVAQTIGR